MQNKYILFNMDDDLPPIQDNNNFNSYNSNSDNNKPSNSNTSNITSNITSNSNSNQTYKIGDVNFDGVLDAKAANSI